MFLDLVPGRIRRGAISEFVVAAAVPDFEFVVEVAGI